jgi:cysteine synthase A
MGTRNEILANTIRRCKERDIIIPTYEQMRDPRKIPERIKAELKGIGLWDLHSRGSPGRTNP